MTLPNNYDRSHVIDLLPAADREIAESALV